MSKQERLHWLLEDIDNDGVGLSDWEIDFLDDMLKRAEAGKPFTEKQEQVIRLLHQDKVP